MCLLAVSKAVRSEKQTIELRLAGGLSKMLVQLLHQPLCQRDVDLIIPVVKWPLMFLALPLLICDPCRASLFDGDTAGLGASLLRSARLQARCVGAAYCKMAALGASITLFPQVHTLATVPVSTHDKQ